MTYVGLPSVKCIYFRDSNYVYKMIGSQPIFQDPIHLESVDKSWIKSLSKEDRKLLEKDLKKYDRPNRETDTWLR